MDDAEVDKLVKEAESKKDEDKKRKEKIESRNMADSLVYQSEKTLLDNKDKVPEADKTEAEGKIADLKKILENTEASKEEIDQATNPLNEVMMKIGQAIYSQSQATPNDAAPENSNS
jgi:molecular chaperone DnaK